MKLYNCESEKMMEYVEENSIDLVATDPPYNVLNYLDWDKSLPNKKIWENCYKSLKPGAFLLAMGATRIYHRLACSIEDSGFKIKECLCFAYASGFPHGKDLSKEIDRKLGLKRKIVGKRIHPTLKNKPKVKSRAYLVETLNSDENKESWSITEPACEKSKQWEGWNTALKPSWESIVVAQKPLDGSYADNVLKWGIGGINIDACRIPYENEDDKNSIASFEHFTEDNFGDERFFSANSGNKKQVNIHPSGRYPANLMYFDSLYPGQYDKIFMIPKPSGIEKYELSHETVKPLLLFIRLIQMFSPSPKIIGRDVIILDPFMGSGTAAIASRELGRDFVGFEKEEKYYLEAKKRIGRIKNREDLF